MAQTFLATKLTIPPTRPDRIARPRLYERLDRALARKLTLVSAPAGYGKTSILSAWADECGLAVAWISLDEGDNDLARFFAYLGAALDGIEPGLGKDLAARLQSPRLLAPGDLLPGTLNAIERLGRPFALILDDYHLIREQAVHTAVMYLLDHLPAPMHVAIASRADPPLRLARLRARSELEEIRLADLRFSTAETDDFLNQVMRLDLTPENVATLVERTEGWVAGLQMAAISIRGTDQKNELIRSFSGSNRYIVDFLAEEIFQQQSPEIQAFLLRTSVVDRMCPELCQALIATPGAQPKSEADARALLDLLDRSNLFILPLDDERYWYRYHQLFLDILRKRLQQTLPQEIPGLHRNASAWYQENGYLSEAIEHALASGETERAADLVEQVVDATLMHSEVATVLGWVRRLPDAMVAARPNLALSYTWILMLTDATREEIAAHADRIAPSTSVIAGKIEVIRAYLDYVNGEVVQAGARARRGMEMLPETETFFRTIASWMFSISYVTTGDFSTGTRSLEETYQISLKKGNLFIATGAVCQLAEIHMRMAQLREARRDYERALALATEATGRRLPVKSRALMGMAEILRETNELSDAARMAQEGIDLAMDLHSSMATGGAVCLARIRQALGDGAGADAAIEQAVELAKITQTTLMDDYAVMLTRAQIQLIRGDLRAVAEWMAARGLDERFDPGELDDPSIFDRFHMRKYECLVAARWWIATGQPERALSIEEALRQRMEAQGRARLVMEAHLVAASAYQKLDDPGRALSSLRQALAIAEPEGYVRLFVDEGPVMAHLLEAALRQGIFPAYTRRLLEAFQTNPRMAAPTAPAPGPALEQPVETLSEREVTLLRLIAEGLSNQEIAQRLFISLPTVKWHTGNIFGKLGVHSRTQAVAKGRAAGFLPPE